MTGGKIGDGGFEAAIRHFQELNKSMSEQLEVLKALRDDVDSMETTVTDVQGHVSVTVVRDGEIGALDIAPAALKQGEALGPLITETIGKAQAEHIERRADRHPDMA
ncbi:YbaB/EbfC family nucleoid-associated protein [Salininema proteolyticum]|uniref:YbaB/EbfC family nucleoid-associated protein n=1 Tax=Salininema proteolyticum TaxID=1607685 RepID=A0ABV8TUC4_9ACTN